MELKTLIFNQLDDVDKHAILFVNKDCNEAIKTTDFLRLIATREQVTKSWLGYFVTNSQAFEMPFQKNLSYLTISLTSHIALLFFSKTAKDCEIAKQTALNKELEEHMRTNNLFVGGTDYNWQLQIYTLKKLIFPRMHGRPISFW